MKWAISEHGINLLGLRYGVRSGDGIVRNVLYNTDFNIPLHLFREKNLSKFSQEKL